MRAAAAHQVFTVALSESRASLARIPMQVLLALFAAVPWLAGLTADGDREAAILVRGTAGAVLAFGLPLWLGAAATGIWSTGHSNGALVRGAARWALMTGRLVALLLLGACALLLLAASLAFALTALSPSHTTTTAFGRVPAEAIGGSGWRKSTDGRVWLADGSPMQTVAPAVGSPRLTVDLTSFVDESSIDVDIIHVPGYGPVTEAPPAPPPGATPSPLRAWYRAGAYAPQPCPVLLDEPRRLRVRVPVESNASVALELQHGGSHLMTGIMPADIRVQLSGSPVLWSIFLLGLGALAAAVPAIACGMLVASVFSRPTALLAVLTLLVLGWLLPAIHLGAKPAIVRDYEAIAPSLNGLPQTGTARNESSMELLTGWYPALALPAARRALDEAETPSVDDVSSQLRWTPVMAAVMLLLGVWLLRWKDFDEAAARE